MALSTLYCGTNDVILAFGGTNDRLSMGTDGTSAIHPLTVGSLIIWASDQIDMYLSPLVGTSGFGTNSGGTKAVPPMIAQITAKLAAAEVMDTLLTGRGPDTSAWSKTLRDRAEAMLEKMRDGEMPIPGIVTGGAGLPKSTSMTFRIRGELITFSGTDIQTLQFQKAIPGSEVVYSTHITGGTVFTRNTDYVLYGYDVGTTAQVSGGIRPANPPAAIGTNYTVCIDYEAWTDHIFGNPADHKVSAGNVGLAQPMTPSFMKELSGDLSGHR